MTNTTGGRTEANPNEALVGDQCFIASKRTNAASETRLKTVPLQPVDTRWICSVCHEYIVNSDHAFAHSYDDMSLSSGCQHEEMILEYFSPFVLNGEKRRKLVGE